MEGVINGIVKGVPKHSKKPIVDGIVCGVPRNPRPSLNAGTTGAGVRKSATQPAVGAFGGGMFPEGQHNLK